MDETYGLVAAGVSTALEPGILPGGRVTPTICFGSISVGLSITQLLFQAAGRLTLPVFHA